MSPIDFDILQTDYPEYASAWTALREWFQENWRKQYVELAVLLRALRGMGRADLVSAINAMVDRGMLEMAYRVRSPYGDLLEGEYAEPDEIPEELWDRDFSHKIPRSEGELVSGFRWESSDAA